jgi:2-acylglycerol O-acyltransferase 2
MPFHLKHAYPSPTSSDTLKVFLSNLFLCITSIGPPVFITLKVVSWCKELGRVMIECKNDADDDEAVRNGRREVIKKVVLKLVGTAALLWLYRRAASQRLSVHLRDYLTSLTFHSSILRYTETTVYTADTLLAPEAQKIVAVVPHGQVPLSLAMTSISAPIKGILGRVRTVAADATKLFPGLTAFISAIDGVSAKRSELVEAIQGGDSLGISPGGVAEMFAGYPTPGYLPTDEGAVLRNRTGFIKLAVDNDLPVVPVYVFGSSSLFRRLHVWGLEGVSKLCRASFVVMYGRWGVPFMPFRKKLRYVVGNPVYPPECGGDRVAIMHAMFEEELRRCFDLNKKDYGWGDRHLKIV